MAPGPAHLPAPVDRIEWIAAERVGEAADVLAAALADDPGFRHLFPDPRRRGRELRALYRLTLADTLRHGHVLATVQGRAITGVVAVYPPGAYPLTAARWWRLLSPLARLALRTRTHAPGLIRFGDVTSAGVPGDAWYVEALGVSPEHQRQGRGRLLMEQVVALVDAAGGLGYLETTKPENVAYYRTLGYEPVREPLPLAPQGPFVHAMARARAAAPCEAARERLVV
ncbi:GNAT family N-acetyltransferase [Cellulomonas sp.]|uniref:GNAT family N-acetyltransferase n=1 Tax=Cellulomonas sp. TaxID=40001 RepID=UPI00258824EF|nr:GNAT family N-acetyltransferase [Cellulomonas sp.]MCR6690690.1 GNAT family N-acetyltransferase [Cellulomonas sp.]